MASAKPPTIVINGGAITVNATPGADPAANADLARQIAAEQEKAMRGLIQNEMNRQRCLGGLLR